MNMKIIFKYLFAFIICSLCSCNGKQIRRNTYIQQEKPKEIWVDHHHAQLVIIDSCEYIKSYTGAGGNVYTHKGNCKHCQHRLLKDIEYIIEKINKER